MANRLIVGQALEGVASGEGVPPVAEADRILQILQFNHFCLLPGLTFQVLPRPALEPGVSRCLGVTLCI